MANRVEAWTSEISQRVVLQAKMAVQVIILVLPHFANGNRTLKEQLRHFVSTNIPIPFIFVSSKKLQDAVSRGGRHSHELFNSLAS